MSKIIETRNLCKSYGSETVLDKLNIWVKEGEFLTLLGPSGCGKTTTLRLIAGFDKQDSGDILFDGQIINNLAPHERAINTVFQRYALFPHLNVFENIAFGLRVKKLPEDEIKDRVEKMLSLINLSKFGKRKIDSLSGGQQQRIAIARALVNKPKVLLLDEPLGALDLNLRKNMQIELKDMQKELGITFIYVTHDQEEALTMSDKIIVMNEGLIQQIGSPTDIYNEPENAFVADFIGDSNLLSAHMEADYLVNYEGHKLKCLDKGFEPNEPVDMVIRPEDIKFTEYNQGMLNGEVVSTVFKGVHYEMLIDINGTEWLSHNTESKYEGEKVGIYLNADDIHIMRKPVAEYQMSLKDVEHDVDEDSADGLFDIYSEDSVLSQINKEK
ncbi:MAG: ABC transporter ATP-binding protein [Bacillota bacterium]|nr:ABC transporter ATP-binding protein [Bacillota bacterium]